MPKIAIMTDSNCGIMPDNAEVSHSHTSMPVLVGKTLFMKDAISHQKSFTETSSGEPVTTSQPSPADVMKMWDQLLKEHDEVVHVPMSSGLSNSCQTALLLCAGGIFQRAGACCGQSPDFCYTGTIRSGCSRTYPPEIHRGADQRNSETEAMDTTICCGRHFGIFKKAVVSQQQLPSEPY